MLEVVSSFIFVEGDIALFAKVRQTNHRLLFKSDTEWVEGHSELLDSSLIFVPG